MGHGAWLMLWGQGEVVAFDPVSLWRSWTVRISVMLVVLGLIGLGLLSRSK
jgi:hypothetical protein